MSLPSSRDTSQAVVGATTAPPERSAVSPKKAKRYGFVDHYRGWAVLVMIETHSVNAWLADSIREHGWSSYLTMVNGFVAPSFLFISGVSFFIVARKRFDSISRFSPAFFSQLRWFLWIWMLGYFMHLPGIAFHGWIPSIPLENLQGLYKVDILQTIAACLVVLLLLCPLLRDLNRLLFAAIALALAALLITPYLWQVKFSQFVHPAIAGYLNGLENPLFPLFPWSVFLWGGSAVGGFFFARAAAQKEHQAVLTILLTGIGLFCVGFFSRSLQLVPTYNFWLDGPQWVLMRLGIVMCIFCLFWVLESHGVVGIGLLILLGTESLFAYIIHLTMIYSVTGASARLPLLDYRSYGLLATSGLFLVLLALSFLLTWLWKKSRPWRSSLRRRD